MLKNYVKNNLKINYVEFCIHAEKDYLLLYKNSTNQIFTVSNGKVVYFK